MVKFHPINRTMTVGTFMFFASLVVLAIGAAFHADGTVLADSFLFGGFAFLISNVLLTVGVILGARSGKLQRRGDEIFRKNIK